MQNNFNVWFLVLGSRPRPVSSVIKNIKIDQSKPSLVYPRVSKPNVLDLPHSSHVPNWLCQSLSGRAQLDQPTFSHRQCTVGRRLHLFIRQIIHTFCHLTLLFAKRISCRGSTGTSRGGAAKVEQYWYLWIIRINYHSQGVGILRKEKNESPLSCPRRTSQGSTSDPRLAWVWVIDGW